MLVSACGVLVRFGAQGTLHRFGLKRGQCAASPPGEAAATENKETTQTGSEQVKPAVKLNANERHALPHKERHAGPAKPKRPTGTRQVAAPLTGEGAQLLASEGPPAAVRGVPPEDQNKYEPSADSATTWEQVKDEETGESYWWNKQGDQTTALGAPKPRSGSWKCLDGKQLIPSDRINDNFCDCKDGSDEPGES